MSNYYEIKIGNRTIKNLYQGASFIERIDEEFDEFRTIQFASKSNQPYPMGAKAEVKINDKTYYFVVAKDTVELFAREPLCYSHTLELKEETELLNHRVAESLGFHRMEAKNVSILEAIERYRRIVPLERRDLHEETRLFNISESLKEKLKETLPEIVLAEGLAFDQLSQFSQLVDAVPYIENGELDFVEFNKRGKLITNNRNIVDISSYHDLTNYITDVVTFISNGTVNHENYTDTPEAFVSPRSEDIVLSDNASQIVLRYPIKDIIKVELVCKISTKYTFNSEEINKFFSDVENYASKKTTVIRRGSEYGTVDITRFVVPIQKYRTLPSEVSNTRLTKANCLYFSYGSNTIEGTGNTFERYKLIFKTGVNVTENLISSLPTWEGEESISPAADGPRNYIFRVTYHPLVRSRVKMSRRDDESVIPSELIASQSASTVDLEKQGKLLQNLIKRLGHADKTLFRVFNSYNNVNHVGDYLSDGYIITAVEHVIYRDYIFSIEQYNKNYNRRSMFVGLNQEPRPFLVGDTVVNRNLNYMEKVVISDALISGTPSLMTDSGKEKFEEMFIKDRTFSTSILDGVILSSYDMDNKKEGGSEEIFLPLVVNEFGNTILLSFELASQTSAGDCVEEKESESYQTLAPVQYTNSKGGAYYLDVNFGSSHITIPIEVVDELPYNNNNITIGGRTWPRGVAYDESQVTQAKPGGNTSIYDYKEGYGMYYWFDNQYTWYAEHASTIYYVKSTKKYYRSYLQQLMDTGDQLYPNVGYSKTYAYYEMFEEVDPTLVYSTIQEQLQDAQDIPKGNKRYLNGLISTNEDTRFVIDKNVSEKISMTYQLCVESDSENIIIGEYFIKNNHFIAHNSEPLMLWISKEKYEVNDTKIAKGNKVVNDNEDELTIILNNDHTLEVNHEFNEEEKSWAIATEEGKLILACNLPIKKVYFNYLNR